MQFLRRTWRLWIALAGISIVRELLQRQKMIDLADKVVLITGGSRGLGLAMAEEFAREGAKLVLCARDQEELRQAEQIFASSGTEVLTLPCDVADEEQVRHTIAQVNERFGAIDVLVNNAGIISAGPWQTQTRADFETSMNNIFWSTYTMTMAVLPQMAERKRGRIVNITSIGGKVSVPHLLSYSSAKFAAVGFSEGLHAELAREGIAVTTVVPGLMRTGSQINTKIKGSVHHEEYTLFTLLDTLPVSSISAQRAARQIVRATRRGSTEVIISLPAQLLARTHGLLPGLTTEVLSLINRLLPSGEHAGKQAYTGRESETAITRSSLTRRGQNASRVYNEE